MDVCTLGLPFALLLSLLLLVTVSTTQECVPQALPDMVIDIGQAVALGARFTDPLSVNSVEECLSACCAPLYTGGDPDCNLLVFDARKNPGLQNCYIFHCPTLDSCPLVSSPGVISYSLWAEPSPPEKQEPQKPKSSVQIKAQGSSRKMSGSTESGRIDSNLRKNSAAIASQGSARHSAQEKPADSSTSITMQLLHLADQIDRHLEKMESNSEDDIQVRHTSPTAVIVPAFQTATINGEVQNVPADAKAAKPGSLTYTNSTDLYFSTAAATPEGTAPTRTKLPLRTAAPQLVPRTNASLIVPPAAPKDVSSASKLPSSNVKLPAGDHVGKNGTPKKNDHPMPHTEVPALTTAKTRHPQIVTHRDSLQTSPWKGIEPNKKTNDEPYAGYKGETPETLSPVHQEPAVHQEEVPRKAEGAQSGGTLPLLEDKTGLVAALIFGILFLMVVIGLVSRKVSEARRRHRYTKLDYLINGMYVDT